jgi:predicted PolB exonuclease-like 3'-5' exonuclease
MSSVIVWDIETVPDIKGFAAANGHDGKSDDEIRAAMGDKFPKHIYHSIICIGALVAHQENGRWIVDALGAPHVGERSEKELISSFVDRIAKLSPQLVTFNGSSFDLPVLRYRARSMESQRRVSHCVPTSIVTPASDAAAAECRRQDLRCFGQALDNESQGHSIMVAQAPL